MKQVGSIQCRYRIVFLLLLGAVCASASAQAPITFTKTFMPDTIGPGSTSTLRFDLTNTNPSEPDGNIAFTDVLPAGIIIATPSGASTTCTNAVLSAPDGGGTITFSGGQLGPSSSCVVTVNVTSNSLGTHTNVSGDLTSDAGNSGTATDDLMVVDSLPGFTKSFSPSTISFGGSSTLTLTFDNEMEGAVDVNSVFVTDNLPPGMIVASPSNASSDCGVAPEVTAIPGTTLIWLSAPGNGLNPALPAGESCTAVVDVTTETNGTFDNVTLQAEINGNTMIGFATDTLSVPLEHLTKAFTDDPVPAGGLVNLEFKITNLDRDLTASNITFTDDLDATLSGLMPNAGLPTDPCGSGSTLSFGSGALTLAGGTLPPSGSCTFSVDLLVPTGATAGAYPNTTSAITSDIWSGNVASDTLVVSDAPVLTKTFTVNPVAAGSTTTVEFMISNPSNTFTATDISFFDDFPTVLPTAVTTPGSNFCGAGSSSTFTPLFDPPGSSTTPARLTITDATLAPAGSPGDSCTFSITLDVAPGVPVGVYPNITSEISATVDGETVIGKEASDDLEIVGGVRLRKEFTDDPVPPGGTATLEFTIEHDANAGSDATDINFTDDLNAVVSGLAAVGLPDNNICGSGSQISGTTNLSFTGGTLAPGGSCTFSVTLQVPGGAPAGSHTNTTSNAEATVSTLTTSGNAATDDLLVTGLLFSKEFIDDPIIAGGTGTLRFTLDNTGSATDATNISFTDNLDDTLSGLATTVVPPSPCGGTTGGSPSYLSFSGGSVLAGTSCFFDVTYLVPLAAGDGVYPNTTSVLGLGAIPLPPATDNLIVSTNILALTKTFTDDPVLPGGTVTLQFDLSNLSPTQAASSISFTDDLNAALSSLDATGLPAAACGGTLSGTSLITLSGASLGPGASCQFSVTLSVPGGASVGNYLNTTSSVTGMVGALAVTGDPASDDLQVRTLAFSKTFDDPVSPGDMTTLTFTIENLDGSSGVTDISFFDDLDAVLTGLAADGLPANDICGSGSQISGTSILTFSGGNLGPGASCSFPVQIQVPIGNIEGTYTNTTSALNVLGAPAAPAASDDLSVAVPPTFSKVFDPPTIPPTGVTSLIFTIDNSAGALPADNIGFTDNLPAGMTVANPANASTTCIGGTLTAVPGTSTVSYAGGSVAAGATCTIRVDVVVSGVGQYMNVTEDLMSTSGNSGAATADLEAAAGIPTATTWGLLLLVGLVAVFGAMQLRRLG